MPLQKRHSLLCADEGGMPLHRWKKRHSPQEQGMPPTTYVLKIIFFLKKNPRLAHFTRNSFFFGGGEVNRKGTDERNLPGSWVAARVEPKASLTPAPAPSLRPRRGHCGSVKRQGGHPKRQRPLPHSLGGPAYHWGRGSPFPWPCPP